MTFPPAKPPPGHRSLLIAALAGGRSEAFAALYDELAPALLRFARTMLGDLPDAQDAVQEVFVNLVRSRHRLVHVADLDAYVFGMLRHAAALHRSRVKRERLKLKELAMLRQDSSAGGPAFTEPDEALQIALARLPEAQREIIALKFDGGLTFAGIGQVLGISPNTAASRYRYALESLRRHLKES